MLTAPSGSDEALVRDLGLLMRELMSTSNPSVFQAVDQLDLSFSQTKIVMSFAWREGPHSVKAIADDHGMSLPAASRAIDGLLKRGLVTRTEDPTDRRVKQIALTDEGRRITQRLVELRVAGIQDFVASLDESRRRELAAVLEPIFAGKDAQDA
jgi:DNA-binding MarR family transcriptional regulator